MTKGSGAVHGDGDIRIVTENLLVECKCNKAKKSVILTSEIFKKLIAESMWRGATPVWVMETSTITPVAVMDLISFSEMLKEMKKMRDQLAAIRVLQELREELTKGKTIERSKNGKG